MKRYVQSAAVLAALTAAPSAPAAVLISEILYNEVGGDTTGEFVEVWNTGATPVDLSGYKVGDEETQGGDSEAGGMWQFPEGTTLNPGQVFTVTPSAARFFEVYGTRPSFELIGNDPEVPEMRPYLAWVDPPENNNSANGSDQALLLGPDDAIADTVSWGNPSAFDPGLASDEADGQSYERVGPIDTDTAADWQLGNPSSPGVAPVPEPAGLAVLGVAGLAVLRRRRRRA